MEKLKAFGKRLWKEESAQGATEYILLLVVVVTVVMIFRDQIKVMVEERLADLNSGLQGISTSN